MNKANHIFWNRFIARVTIIALLFQAMVTAFHLPANALGKPGSFSLLGKTITICTGDGIKSIRVNTDNPTDQEQSDHKVRSGCDVCLAYADNQAFDNLITKAISPNPPRKQSFSLSCAPFSGFMGLLPRVRAPPSLG